MVCASCNRKTSAEAKFCGHCGAALVATCASCGHRNPAGTRFCTECGTPVVDLDAASPTSYTPENLAEKIRAGRTELEGERKVITVLFADIAGFTRMSSELDPEDVHGTVRRCFDVMLTEIHRYEGTVSQFLGDGMLALFGAPIAHEDHAQRAVRAGLAIQAALQEYRRELRHSRGIEFGVRIGLNSGPVVVSRVGVDLTMDYLAVGDTVNLASRMQSVAESGSVVISENTMRLVEGYFIARDLGPRQVKGKDEPVGVYEVVRPLRSASRVDVSAARGLVPYVGRQRELDALLDRFEGTKSGAGQVVFLEGDAGIGKSRLVYELRQRIGPADATWLVGRCISYGRDIPYLPIIDLVKDALQIEENDREAAIVAKVEARTPPAGAPYLRHLLGADAGDPAVATLDAQLRKARTFEALLELAATAAGQRPQVLVLEDLHWVDQASIEFLSYFVEHIGSLGILLVLTHRPEWQAPLGVRPYFTKLSLENLSAGDSAAIGAGVLGAAMPAEVEQLVFEKAEGNPFFVEEVTRALVEMGALRRRNGSYELTRPLDELDVPDTVQGVIMARLDRLPEDPRRALQTASVIGREFTVRLLDRIADLPGQTAEPLRELRSLELIFERSLYPELQYMFKHALTHDVAYSSLLLARRKTLHRVVAAAIEELYADRLAEHFEMVAFHAEQGENWQQAFDFLVRSGDKALQSFSPSSAHDFYVRALAIVERGDAQAEPAELIQIHLADGQALYLVSRFLESAEAFSAAEQFARSAGDPLVEGTALFQRAISLHWGHRFEAAMDAAQRAREIGLEQGNDAIVAGSLITIEGVYAVTGNQAVTEVMEEASAIAARSQVPMLEAFTAVWEGFIHHWRGNEERALEIWGRGEGLGKEHQIAAVLLWTLWNRSLALIGRGRYDEALGSLRDHLDLTERLGDRAFRSRTLNTLGWLHIDLCNWATAIAYNTQGSELSHEVGDPEIIRNAEINLGDCYLGTGDLDAAQHWLEGVERACERTGEWGEDWMKWRYAQHLDASLAELWLARGDAERALGYADRCVERAEDSGSKRNIVKGCRARGKALAALGRESQADLERALELAREVGNPAQVWQTLDALGKPAEALAVVEEVARGLRDRALAEGMLASPQIARLRS